MVVSESLESPRSRRNAAENAGEMLSGICHFRGA